MNVRALQNASRGERSVVLLVLELGTPAPLYTLILHLPPDGRGRSQDWARTTRDVDEACELYEQALRDHISDEEPAARPPVEAPRRAARTA